MEVIMHCLAKNNSIQTKHATNTQLVRDKSFARITIILLLILLIPYIVSITYSGSRVDYRGHTPIWSTIIHQ